MPTDDAEFGLVASRRAARRAAFECLYSIEVGKGLVADAIGATLARGEFSADAAAYLREAVIGVESHLSELDEMITPLLAQGWNMARIAITDKTILRLACFELFYMAELPPKVTIDEAVNLAKRFNSEESGKFVNGVLGKLLPLSPKATWSGETSEEEAEDDAINEMIDEGSPAPEEDVQTAGWTIRSEKGPAIQ